MKEEWLEKALFAQKNAYTPYSKFNVGAALIAKSGEIYTGCNIENASFGLTNCAERTAIFKAVSEGVQDFQALVIVGDTPQPIAPCGACRQVIAEFCDATMPVYLVGKANTQKKTTVGDLLPYMFTSEDL